MRRASRSLAGLDEVGKEQGVARVTSQETLVPQEEVGVGVKWEQELPNSCVQEGYRERVARGRVRGGASRQNTFR